MKRKYYILANGEGTRWNNYMGAPKQLAKVDGETILHRMCRLLHEEGVEKKNIIICGPFEDEFATSVITKSKTKREVFEEIANLAKGPFAILYGDCYYTKAIIHEMATRPVIKYDEFFTVWGNPHTGCAWAEGYAHRCDDWEWWRDQMHEINTNEDLIKTCKDWFIHWWLLGVRDERINQHPQSCIDRDHDIFWCDETDDFDFPEDYDKFIERHNSKKKGGFRADKLSIIIPHYNTPDRLKSLIAKLLALANEYPETEFIVVDDGSTCDMEFLKQLPVKAIFQHNKGAAAARNVGLNAATGRYIVFVDADDDVEGDYLRVIYKTMRDTGCDYIQFPFKNIYTDEEDFLHKRQLIGNYAVWSWAFTYDCIGDVRFNENLNVAEDMDFLERVITPDKKRYEYPRHIYKYDWLANPDSLQKRFDRGEITKERNNDEDQNKDAGKEATTSE